MGAEFVTFDNAVNAMPRIIRRCGLYGCTQKLFMSFLLPADYPPCGLSGGNYGRSKGFIHFFFHTLTCQIFEHDSTKNHEIFTLLYLCFGP